MYRYIRQEFLKMSDLIERTETGPLPNNMEEILGNNNLNEIKQYETYEMNEYGEQIKVIIKIYDTKKNLYEINKKFIKKYQEKNKNMINKKNADRKRGRYQNDEEYREILKQKNREAYQRRKEKLMNTNINNNIL
jgi:hypothetical protein